MPLATVLAGPSACAAASRPADTVVYASGADLESANPLVTIHPLAQQIERYALFVTLARYDDALQPAPYYARAWRWSGDRRELTLSLVPGLSWHDSVPTTARDVAFTLEAARDPATGYPRYADLSQLAAVRVGTDTSITLAFTRPQSGFPLVLCELPIVPAHLLDTIAHADLRRTSFDWHPVGNGPYRFVDRRVGQRWMFARNDAFPAALGGPPRVRRFVVAVVDEPATKFAGLVSGELDVAGIAPSMAALAARDPSLRVLDYPVLMTYGIVFDVGRAPFDDARVRRALTLAIDRRRIVQAALAGYGTPAAGPVPAAHPFAAPDTAILDTAAADSLLDAAGWRRDAHGVRTHNGRPLAFELLTVGSGDNAVEQLLQADFAAIGVRMAIRQRDLATFLALARQRPPAFDALFTGVPGDLSLSYLSAMFDSHEAGGALDYGGFHTPGLDSLLAAARDAPDAGHARAAWIAVQHELARDVPVAWVYDARGVQGIARRLDGVRMDLRGELVTLHDWMPAKPAVAAR